MPEPVIYNCHIHTFTIKHVPRNFLRLTANSFVAAILTAILETRRFSKPFIWFVRNVPPFSKNDVLQRQIRFLRWGNFASQTTILRRIQRQYPPETVFVVLPMDMKFIGLGPVPESIDKQHEELLELARRSDGQVIPFYAVDPRREDIVARVRDNLSPDKFRGVKIYPNLGFCPYDDNLMKVYEICEQRNVPVMSHGTAGGVWQYGSTAADRVRLSHPANYRVVLKTFPKLRVCIAHFGGAEEWDRHWRSEVKPKPPTWLRWIISMMQCGRYPNLYTDISYTLFKEKPTGFYFDYFDYLKVLLADPKIRERVLFGTDYYMIELESMREKELSIGLRSRLGEALYFQIAHENPKRYLGISK